MTGDCRSRAGRWRSTANRCRSCPPGFAGAWPDAPPRRAAAAAAGPVSVTGRGGAGGAGESSVQIHLTARHCELAADVRSFAQQRLEKLNKYDTRIHEVRVIVTQE